MGNNKRASRDLSGLSIYVSGSAGGIGNAVCHRLRAEGANVIGMGRSPHIEEWQKESGIPAVEMDQTDPDSVKEAFVNAAKEVGPPDGFIACAGIMHGSGPFEDITLENWQRYIDVNLTGSFLTCREAARLMVKAGNGGSIVTVGSVNSFMSEPNAAPYVASKGGLWMMTRAMSVDLSRHGIRANMIAPGVVDTNANQSVSQGPIGQHFRGKIALGRVGLPEECAGMASLLVSDDASYMTGAHFVIDGGMTSMIFGETRAMASESDVK